MNRRRTMPIIAVVVLCTLTAGTFGKGAPARTLSLAGNSRGIWLVRTAAKNNQTFDVVAKAAGHKWKWIAREISGQPAAIAAAGGRLHVLFARPTGYLTFGLSGNDQATGLNPQLDRWPADAAVLAACGASGLAGRAGPCLVAIVPRTAAEAAPPVTAEDTDRSARLVRLGVFQNASGQWEHLTDLDGVHLTDDGRVFAAALGDALYIFIAGGDPADNRLAAWLNGAWQDVPLPRQLRSHRVLGMLAVGGRVGLVLATPGQNPDRLTGTIATLTPEKMSFDFQPIMTAKQEPADWKQAAAPLVTRLGERIALVWPEADDLYLACCDLTGRLDPARRLEVFDRKPASGFAYKLQEYVQWGALAALLIPMLFLRRRTLPMPFALPVNIIPGSLPKRALAGAIDLLLFVAISSTTMLLLQPEAVEELRKIAEQRLSVRQTMELIRQSELAGRLIIASIAARLMYVAYCIVMEYRLGATLGKMLMSLRVVGDAGKRPDFRGVFLRNVTKIMEFSWPLLPLLLIVPILSRRRQRIGDMIARTAVVETVERPVPPQPPSQDDENNPPPEPPG
ncbi:MAG: RDD family protein [Planctomycetota bacterium]|nr:RDD family protein [Planctomycetota bacterium]